MRSLVPPPVMRVGAVVVSAVVSLVAMGCGRVAFDAAFDAAGDAAGDAVPAAGCPQLACGLTGTEDCCARRALPSGTYLRSFDVAVDMMYDDASNAAIVPAFGLDRFEVTVARFRAFVDAGLGTQASPPASGVGGMPGVSASGWDSGWNPELDLDTAALLAQLNCEPGMRQTWSDAPGAFEAHPINCVDWYVAFAYCAWHGGFLPSEAQWNFAAAGGDEQRAFPFSTPAIDTAIDCTRAAMSGCAGDTVVAGSSDGYGRWDHADLAGNVWEWVMDRGGGYSNPCTGCVTLGAPGATMIRGGSFFDGANTLRTGNRVATGSGGRSTAIGFRCAYAP